MRLNTTALAITGAAVSAIAYIMGGVLHVLAPWGAPGLIAYVFRVDVYELSQPFGWGIFLISLAVFTGTGAVFGVITAWTYNTIVSHEISLVKLAGQVSVPKA